MSTATASGRARGDLPRHAWLLALLVGTLLFVAVERTMVATRNPHFVPTAILVGASVVPVAFLLFVRGRALPYGVSGGVVLTAGLLGGVVGTMVAGFLEYRTLQDLGALPMVAVAVIEEGSKLLVPAALLVVLSHRSRADGLLIGVACGAGFAALETMGYAFVEMVQSRGSITDTTDLLMLRGFLSPAGHMAWTGITAAALYTAAAAGWRRTQVVRLLIAFGVAVTLHALWDGFGSLPVFAVLAVVSLGLLTATAHGARPQPAPDGSPHAGRPVRRTSTSSMASR